MHYKELSYSVSQKLNCGNYESKGIMLSASMALDETDDLAECKAELAAKLNQLLEEEVKKEKQQIAAVAYSRR